MDKIPVEDILRLFEKMKEENWRYTMGAAEEGCVDCSGAFVYAYKKLGNISIYHGSNWMARNEACQLLPITAAQPGMLAFKAREETEKGYALPDKYKDGTDTRDYYHVGLVSRDGCRVLNAAGADYGFISSSLSTKNGWGFVSYAKNIDYGGKENETETQEEGNNMTQMMVTASSGSTVNRRVAPKAGAALLDRIKIGTVVTVVATDGTWSTVQYDGTTGYMMSQYLQELDSTDSTTTDTDTTLTELLERVQKLEERVQALEGGVG